MKSKHLCVFIAALTVMPASAKTLTVAVDISGSNPLVTVPAFAAIAGRYASEQIKTLELGDTVEIKTIGDRSLANFRTEKIRITRKDRADKTGQKIAQFIESLPAKNMEGSGETNLVAFFEFGNFDCANSGRVLVLTDGIESSPYMNAEKFMAGKALPAPEANFLSGCEITMYGFGQNSAGEWPSQAIKNMRASWAAWMKKAGAKFTPIINP